MKPSLFLNGPSLGNETCLSPLRGAPLTAPSPRFLSHCLLLLIHLLRHRSGKTGVGRNTHPASCLPCLPAHGHSDSPTSQHVLSTCCIPGPGQERYGTDGHPGVLTLRRGSTKEAIKTAINLDQCQELLRRKVEQEGGSHGCAISFLLNALQLCRVMINKTCASLYLAIMI